MMVPLAQQCRQPHYPPPPPFGENASECHGMAAVSIISLGRFFNSFWWCSCLDCLISNLNDGTTVSKERDQMVR